MGVSESKASPVKKIWQTIEAKTEQLSSSLMPTNWHATNNKTRDNDLQNGPTQQMLPEPEITLVDALPKALPMYYNSKVSKLKLPRAEGSVVKRQKLGVIDEKPQLFMLQEYRRHIDEYGFKIMVCQAALDKKVERGDLHCIRILHRVAALGSQASDFELQALSIPDIRQEIHNTREKISNVVFIIEQLLEHYMPIELYDVVEYPFDTKKRKVLILEEEKRRIEEEGKKQEAIEQSLINYKTVVDELKAQVSLLKKEKETLVQNASVGNGSGGTGTEGNTQEKEKKEEEKEKEEKEKEEKKRKTT